MIAFALNSLICREAMGSNSIDAMSYAVWRSAAAFCMLGWATSFRWLKMLNPSLDFQNCRYSDHVRDFLGDRSRLLRALAWAGYSLTFSWAYTRLDTGQGALMLFGITQVTMIILGRRKGECVPAQGWAGAVVATLGLATVTLRNGLGVFAGPALFAMSIAGLNWGGYSLLARDTTEPRAAICDAFFWSFPVLFLAFLISACLGTTHHTAYGIALACGSGTFTTALAYWAWYVVMAQWETSSNAATKGGVWQLSVPVIAAMLGISFLRETSSPQLWLGTVLVVSGIIIAISATPQRDTPSQ